MEYDRSIVVAWSVLGLFIAVLAVVSFGPGGLATDKPDIALTPVGHGNVYTWGFQQENISAPMDLSMKSDWRNGSRMLAEGDVAMADVTWPYLPELMAENPDLTVLPYQNNVPDTTFGIWVHEDSNITEVSDLDGARVAAPQIFFPQTYDPIHVNRTSMFVMLQQRHNVSPEFVNRSLGRVAGLEAARTGEVKEGEIDAVFLVGDSELPDDHSLRPVYLPFDRMRDRHGDSGLPSFLVVRDDPDLVRAGMRMVEAISQSASQAQNDSEEFKDVYAYCNNFMVLRDGEPQIERMTPEYMDAMQELFDAAYEQGRVDQRIDFSEHVLDPDRLADAE